MSEKLTVGTEVTINIPFTYTIGDNSIFSSKVLKTVDDCKDEVRREIESGSLNSNVDIFLNVGEIIIDKYK